MRWRKNDLSFDSTSFSEFFSNRSIAELMVEFLSQVLADRNVTSEFRLVGHSLGSQIAIRYCQIVLNSNVHEKSYLLPDHIVLADPYMTLGSKEYLNGSNSQNIAIQVLRDLGSSNVSKVLIQSSPIADITLNSVSSEILSQVLYARLDPAYVSVFDIPSLHVAGINLYLNQYLQINDKLSRLPAILSKSEIASYSTNNIALVQSKGGATISPIDDTFDPIHLSSNFFKIISIFLKRIKEVHGYPTIIEIGILLGLANLALLALVVILVRVAFCRILEKRRQSNYLAIAT
jgi:hypothetical protein